jgi:Fe-S-cluster containining protein
MTDQNEKKSETEALPWYKEGLRFKCTECGQCCTGSPGYVWVSEQEMLSIANLLNITIDLFKRKYVRQRNNRYALVEKKSQNNDCIFLKDKKCTVYQARPSQCRTFPWWKENLTSKESWDLAAKSCEGINDEAPVVQLSQINEMLQRNSE